MSNRSGVVIANSSASQALVKRGRFYDETVTFEVEGTVHRVGCYGFERWSHSVFRDLFSLPQGETLREGETDDHPIKLVGCTNFEFESLLEVMFPRAGAIESPSLSKEQWIGVLKLSRLWDMPEISTFAINQLCACNLTPMEKIKLGREHGVPAWLKDGYSALISDISQVSLEDISGLGWETACRILWAHKEMAGSISDPAGLWVPAGELICSPCERTYGHRRKLDLKSQTKRCAYCNVYRPGALVDAYTLSGDPSNTSSGPRLQAIAEKVSELFGEELFDAERRNIIPDS